MKLLILVFEIGVLSATVYNPESGVFVCQIGVFSADIHDNYDHLIFFVNDSIFKRIMKVLYDYLFYITLYEYFMTRLGFFLIFWQSQAKHNSLQDIREKYTSKCMSLLLQIDISPIALLLQHVMKCAFSNEYAYFNLLKRCAKEM